MNAGTETWSEKEIDGRKRINAEAEARKRRGRREAKNALAGKIRRERTDLKVGHYNRKKKHAAKIGYAAKTAGLKPGTTNAKNGWINPPPDEEGTIYRAPTEEN
jgi:hypothetical protein